MNYDEISDKVKNLVEKNKWDDLKTSPKLQTHRNIAISILLEASELLENYQWSEVANVESVKDELADIVIYSSYLASLLEIDLQKAIDEKMEKNFKRVWSLDLE